MTTIRDGYWGQNQDPPCERCAELEAKLAEAQADSDGNYTQGIQRGRIIALRAINSMPEPYGINKMDRAVHYAIRADCIEAINNAIDATREESE